MSGYPVPVASSRLAKKKPVNDTEGPSALHIRDMINPEEGKFYYGVSIVTGEKAGTAGNPCIELVGDKAKTGMLQITGFFAKMLGKGVKKGVSEVLVIETDSELGDVLVVTVGVSKASAATNVLIPSVTHDDWHVCTITVVRMSDDKTIKFPCFHFLAVGKEVSVTANTTTEKDIKDNAILKHQRVEQLKQRKELYEWQKFEDSGIPSAIKDDTDDLPADEQFGRVRTLDFYEDALKGFFGLGKRYASLEAAKLFITVDELFQYAQLATTQGGPTPILQASRWATDVEFGRQMLNGVNPVVIERCEKLPDNFPVTEEMVAPFLMRGVSLQKEMKNGNVYICNMKLMDDLPTRAGYYNCAPICLLYVNLAKQLVPIAIQLKQGVRDEEKQENPIFLPNDHYIDWVRAKMYYQSAHSQYHQLLTHYTSCHATMEAFSMGIQRNLPDPHPIFKLLRPFTRYTMAINARARATLINDDGIIAKFFGIGKDGKNELFKRIGESYNIHISNIKKFAEKRGVADASKLPGYYYRDDGFKLWDSIEGYARDVITKFYKSDADVKGDPELQAFAEDCHTNGFPGFGKVPDGHGFPKSINTIKELIELCTLIMFTGSAQHASVNFQQYFIYQYVPNAPFGVRIPVPTEKNKADYETLLKTLPGELASILAIGVTYILSQYSDDERLLGVFEPLYGEEEATRYIERFQENLRGITGDIFKRNKEIDMPYIGMVPEKIPNSITI